MTERFDLVIRNGIVVDGTRAPRYAADVAVSGDRIARIGSLGGARGELEIDAAGKIVAPGFIDAHTHDDRLMLSAPAMAPKVSQGVTTVVAGNCGNSLAPMPAGAPQPVTPPLDLLDDQGAWFRFGTFAAYVAALRDAPAATNAALLVGHTTLRVATMEDVERPARGDEIRRMREMVREALAAGAIGVSTGLYYEPAAAATTEEVIEICRPLAESGGLYCTHMRDEGDRVLDSLEETFRVGREVGVPVVVSHHKVVGLPNHGRSRETLPVIAERMKHQTIGLDCYPYCASSTILSASRARIASRVLVTWSKTPPSIRGGTSPRWRERWAFRRTKRSSACAPPARSTFDGRGRRAAHSRLERTMVGSDGLPHDAAPHPRLWGPSRACSATTRASWDCSRWRPPCTR